MARIVDILARLLVDDAGFEADVVRKSQKAGDAAGAAMGTSIAAGISKGATQIGKTLGSIGQDLTKTGRSMTTNLTLPILAAGAATSKLALDFDTAGRQIVGLTDVTADELDSVKEKILALGPAVGKGPQELIEAFYFIASAGFKADEAMTVLETSAKAAAAGLGETQTIAQVLGGVINAYGRENITAARAADILTEAVSQGTAEASGLASVIGNVVPGAAALGVSFDQVTAAMAGMTLSGVGVEESATSLIQIFSSLQKPTSQAEEALEGLGLSSAELRRQLREEGLLATLRTLEERFAGNETAAAAVFGNIRALRGVTALLTLDSTQLNDVFAKVNDSLGRMETAYSETEGPQRDLDRAMADLQVTAIQLGEDVLPMVVEVIQQIAGAAREFGKWWRSLDEDTRKQIVTWLAWVAIAGPALILIGKLATGLGALFKVVGFLAGAKGLPLLATKIKALGVAGSIAAGGIIAVGLAVGQMNADIIETQIGFAKRIRALGADITEVFNQANELAAETGVSWNEAAESIVSGMEAAAEGAAAAEKRMGEDARGWIRDMKDAATAVAEEIPTEVAATLEQGQFVVQPAAEEMVDPIQEALKQAVADAATRAQEIINALATTLATGPEQIKDEMEALIEALTNPYTEVERLVDLEGALAADAFADALASGDPRLEADAFTRMQALLGQYELIAPGALAAGELVNPALQEGIDSNLAAALQWVQANVTGPYTNLFDLADVLEGMGYEGLASYARGLALANAREVQLEASKVANTVKSLLPSDFWKEGNRGGRTYADGWEASIPYLAGKIVKVGSVPKNLLETFSEPKAADSPLRGITKWGYNAVRTIALGALRAVPEMVRAFSAVGRAMVPQVGTLQPAFAGMSVPSVGTAGVFSGAAGAGSRGGDTTNIYLTVAGKEPVVSTAVEIAEQAARLGRFKG